MHERRNAIILVLAATGAAIIAPAVSAGDFPSPVSLGSLNGTNGFTIRGVTAGDQSGGPAAEAGDLNGDGIGDLIVGAAPASPGGQLSAGTAYVIFGTDQGFPALFLLSSLNGTNGFTIHGAEPGDEAGARVGPAGDVNNDGIDDVIIGAEGVDVGLSLDYGAAYIIFGSQQPFPAVLDLGALNGTNGFMIRGRASDDECGSSAAAAGDVNNDGIDDVIIGAQGANANFFPDSGEAYVVFGHNPPFPALFDLNSLDGTNGFLMQGVDPVDETGRSVAGSGDVNGDGIDDVVVGAGLGDPNGNLDGGEAYVVFGHNPPFAATLALSSLNGTNGFKINGVAPGDQCGTNVDGAGDLNGDGLQDILVGANNADPGGRANAGTTYVIFGSDAESFPASLNLSTLNGTSGFVLNGISPGEGAGRLGRAGDVNGDGFDDVMIGAPGAAPNNVAGSGRAYVFLGHGQAFAATIELTTLNGSNGFIANGATAAGGAGRSVRSAGDVNGDGGIDVIIGAKDAAGGAGESYVLFGIAPKARPCPGDTNGDGEVDVQDLTNVIVLWDSNGQGPGIDADINDDGEVNVQDLTALITNWGLCG